jgi:hypothetical protein
LPLQKTFHEQESGGYRSRTINGGIQLTKVLDRKADQSGNRRWTYHITSIKNGIVQRAKLLRRHRPLLSITRGHHDLRTIRDKSLCGSQTNSCGSPVINTTLP